jgi:purine-nucleoside phosphorylase
MVRAKSPSHHILQRRTDRRKERIPVLIPFLRGCQEVLAKKTGLEMLPHVIPREGRLAGRQVAVVNPGFGASAAVLTLEETFRRGYRDFLFLGACGGLAKDLKIGDIILPDEAISEEGTSPLYTSAGPRFKANAALADLLDSTAASLGTAIRRGLIWTTDAPYMETPAKITKYRKQGAIGVEMETSALFAVAGLRKARAAGLLVVSDLLHKEWIIGWNRKAYAVSEDKALEILMKSAMSLAEARKR